jgi:predicted RNA-binding protein with PUA-like domain
MKIGDKAFFYHSSAGKATGIVGEVEVSSVSLADISLNTF